MIQAKMINFIGQEGSGVYDFYDSLSTSRFILAMVDKAGISTEQSPAQRYRASRGLPALRSSECKAKFKVI